MDDLERLWDRYHVADNWIRCVECRWVYAAGEAFEWGSACPNCGAMGLHSPFPRVEAWHLIGVVLGHAERLSVDSSAQERDLSTRLTEAGMAKLDPPALRELAAAARLRVERGGYNALSEVGEELSRRGLPGDQAMQLALELLMIAGQASPDVEAVIVLAATALEALLDELWTETLRAFGLAHPAVSPIAGSVRRASVPRQRMILAELADEDGARPFDREFIARWDEVLERRNAVVHGRPFQVSTPCAREAIALTASAIAAFAEANNRLLAAAGAGAGAGTEPD